MRMTEQITLYSRNNRFVSTIAIPVFDPPPEIVVWKQRFFVRALGENGVHYRESWCYPGSSDAPDAFHAGFSQPALPRV